MRERYYSLDVFRGATVAFMILVNNPGSWSYIFPPLDHSEWNGCTPTDLVFPFFLFAVGNAFAFVLPRLESGGQQMFLQKVLKRGLLIFLIGLGLNWYPFMLWKDDMLVYRAFGVVRIFGVLQRIALCYLFASLLLYYLKPKGVLIASVVLLLLYWILCYGLGSGLDPYSMKGYWGLWVDKVVLGEAHMYHGEGVAFDPEGIVSTMTAIVNVVLGYFVGNYILRKGKTYEMLSNLFVAGFALMVVAYFWDLLFPINKKIWTSSYVLYTGGLATIVLGVVIYLIEFKNQRGVVTHFFDVFGKNPLFIFVLSVLVPRTTALVRIPDHIDPLTGKQVYIAPMGWYYKHVCDFVKADHRVGSLVYAVSIVVTFWLLAYVLDRKKIYIKV